MKTLLLTLAFLLTSFLFPSISFCKAIITNKNIESITSKNKKQKTKKLNNKKNQTKKNQRLKKITLRPTAPQTKATQAPKQIPHPQQAKSLQQDKKEGFLYSSLSYIDGTQRFISSSWVGINHNFDMYFADQEYNKTKNQSKITLAYEVFKQESLPMENYFDFKIRVHLPKLSKRLSVTIQKERDEILETRTNPANRTQATKQSDYNAGVSYLVQENPYFKTSWDTGIKLHLPLNPYTKFKIYRGIESKIANVYIGQQFIYYRQTGVSEVTQLSFSKKLGRHFALSQSNSLSWTDEEDQFFGRNGITLHHQFSQKVAMSYNAGANAKLSPTYYYYSYDASVIYRQELYKKWLFGSLSFGAEFPKDKDWKAQQFGSLRFEVLFQ